MNKYPDAPYQISFVEWLGYNIVNSAVIMLCVFFYLQAYYIGIRCKDSSPEEAEVIKVSAFKLKSEPSGTINELENEMMRLSTLYRRR